MFLLKKPVKDYFPLTPLNSYKLGRFASDMADFKLEVTDSGHSQLCSTVLILCNFFYSNIYIINKVLQNS